MDSIVTARVPIGIKEQGRIALQKIGATPTDLINAAYRYVLEEGKLPQVESTPFGCPEKPRRLSAAQKKKLKQRLHDTTFPVPISYWEGKTDDDLLEQALREKYESAR